MSKITLKALKAKHGDALVLSTDKTTILLDGGPSGVYNQTLKEELKSLPHKPDQPPHLDLLIVSHIDADHLDGILDLTNELIEAREDEQEGIVTIKDIWHNSFADVIASPLDLPGVDVEQGAGTAASVFEDHFSSILGINDTKMVLASVAQGRQLRLDSQTLRIKMNRGFKDDIILQGNSDRPWKKNGLELSVIGPTAIELDKLRETWAEELEEILKKEGAGVAASIKKLDQSVSNLASIVVIAKFDGKSILLTGDARGDKIVKWLEHAGELKPGGTTHFDIIKQQHHGSPKNADEHFFRRVTADHYVVSGNGGHGNPAPLTFERLFAARPDLSYKIHMTYTVEELCEKSSYIRHGNDVKLKALLEDPLIREIFKFPKPHEQFISVTL